MNCTRSAVLLALLSPLSAQLPELRVLTRGDRVGWPWHAAYDPVRQRVVLPDASGYSNEWDGVRWSREADRGAFPGFCYFASGSGHLIIVRDDHWRGPRVHERVGHSWREISPAVGPLARYGMAMAYDRHRGELLAFGGETSSGLLDETWTFDGANWQLHNVAGPQLRESAAACFDQIRQRVVLFGGRNYVGGAPTVLADTWEWDGAWTQVPTAVAPPPRIAARMSFDAARGVAVMCGGEDASFSLLTDLWEYDGSNWQQRTSLPVTSAEQLGDLVYDEARSETLLLGWEDLEGYYGDVLAWDGVQWQARPGLGMRPFQFVSPPSLDHTGNFVLQLRDGPLPELLGWNGSEWLTLHTGGLPAGDYAALWSMNNATYAYIRAAGPASPSETWRWDGTGWTLVTSGVGPAGSNVAVHTSQGHALMFGGVVGTSPGVLVSSATWKFDGTTWQQLPSPPMVARFGALMAYDPERDRVVMHGGYGVSAVGNYVYPRRDTYEHDGVNWSYVGTMTSDLTLTGMAYDSSRRKIVAVGNVPGPMGSTTYDLNFLEFDGSGWTRLRVDGDAISALPVLANRPMACTGTNGRLVLLEEGRVAELLTDPARAESYGDACTTAAPNLLASELPRFGQAHFALEVTRAPANGLVALTVGNEPGHAPLLGCDLLVGSAAATTLLLADPQGFASWPAPLPTSPAFFDLDFYFQAAVLDPTAPNGVTFSRGLRITLGE